MAGSGNAEDAKYAKALMPIRQVRDSVIALCVRPLTSLLAFSSVLSVLTLARQFLALCDFAGQHLRQLIGGHFLGVAYVRFGRFFREYVCIGYFWRNYSAKFLLASRLSCGLSRAVCVLV